MNDYANTKNSAGLLKQVAPKGKIAQMNQNMPMMQALRAKRDELKKP